MRVDRVRRSLEAPYLGPFEVVKRFPKYFTIKLPQGENNVSIDRLKPAYLHSIENSYKPSSMPDSSASSDRKLVASEESTNSSTSNSQSSTDSFRPTVTTRSGRVVKFRNNPDFHYF